MTAHSKRTEQYEAMKASDDPVQFCRRCGITGSKDRMDRHHPKGRWGENVFNYAYYCKHCHRWIHSHPAQAKKEGHLDT